jgi:hypothetical protein
VLHWTLVVALPVCGCWSTDISSSLIRFILIGSPETPL